MAYLENLFSDFLIADFGEKYTFRWTGLEEEDENRRHEIRKLAMTLDEARAMENLPPMKGPLGDAPINPSLIGPWMQMQEGGGEDGQEDQGPGPGGETDAAPEDAPKAPKAEQAEDADPLDADFTQAREAIRGALQKADLNESFAKAVESFAKAVPWIVEG
jgi:hypothetical protein